MKQVLSFLFSAVAMLAVPLCAQTAATKPAVHPTATTHAAPGCAKLPAISPKVPALPAGLGCAKPLYTMTTTPAVKLDYVSPMEGPGLRETLGIGPSSFSLDYIDTKVGTGALAAPHKWYTIHYTGYLTDGTKFDSSLDRGEPISIPYGQHGVIPGWDTGFDGMRIGGKRRLFIPYQLAYGASGRPPTIPPKAELIFDVELLGQSDEKPAPKTPPAPPAAPAAAPAPKAPDSSAPAAAPTAAPATAPPAATAPAAQPAPAPASAPAPGTTTPPKP